MSDKVASLDFEKFHSTIAGKSRNSPKVHNGINPSDKTKLWDVPIATEHDLDDAVKSGQEAFKKWSKTTWKDRQDILLQMVEELLSHRDEMAQLILKECGKPIQFAQLEVDAAAGVIKFHATIPPPKEQTIQDDEELNVSLRYVPLGVVGAICPWNFPLILYMQKIVPGLLTGNTVIVKPSPFTPYSALKFVEMSQKLLPPGVLQALNGDDRLGPMMTEHPGIEKISFTGSIATGKRIMMSSAKTLKRVTLELGGNSACIVCPDVDVNKVAPLVALGAFFNSGQLCVASKRLYVHTDIYKEFQEALLNVVKSWKVGPAGEPGMMLGPVQNEMQYNIVKGFFEDCAVNGYQFALGGEIGNAGGFSVQPAIIDNPPHSSRIVSEEPFGKPNCSMMPWSTEEELLTGVNDTRTGLGGAVYCADQERAVNIAKQIEAGTIWINSFEKPLPNAFFSGHKESGIGGENGEQGLFAYLNAQAIHLYKVDVGKGSKL